MSKRKTVSVFISYARRDGAELARRLCDDLGKKGVDAWLDTQRLAGGATWSSDIEQEIDNRSAVLALLTRGSYESEICRSEQLRALRKGKRVIPVLAQQGCDIPLHLESKNYRDLSGAKPYETQFRTLLTDLAAGKGGVSLKEAFRQTYVTAPPLPPNYVARPDALAALRARLITDGSDTSIAITALRGMGGIGKTVLAQALCRDEVVQQAFPDGVLWVTAGREPTSDLSTRMREVRRALRDTVEANETELECINRYRTVLREKAALVIVDDVWNVRDVEPFRAESPRSRILFTTRDASIAAALGAEEHIANLLRMEQSREMFGRWSGLGEQALPPEAADLIDECGRLPLALAMIGAMVRAKPREYWRHVLDLLRSADLAKIRAAFPDYPHHDLLRAIQVSVEALDPQTRDRYFALAVLLDDMPVPPEIQQVLWNTNAMEAVDAAEQFIGLSLAQREGEGSTIRLHDLQLDYVRAQHSDHEALRLIQDAIRLSAAAIERDPWQFTSQVVGRLLSYKEDPAVRQFTEAVTNATRAAAQRPWLCPVRAALHPPRTGLVRTLEGHAHYVKGVAMTPDGRRAVSGSWDDTLKVWDLESGRVVHTLEGHADAVNEVAVTPDGRRAVSASSDETLKVWDLESGRVIRTLRGHVGPVWTVAVSPDGRRAVSASGDGNVKVWDLKRGRAVRTLKGHASAVYGMAVSPDGRRALSASEDKTVKVWDLECGHVVYALEGHTNTAWGVEVSPDGRLAVSASGDQTLKVWDLERGRVAHTLEGHTDSVFGVAVTPDGRRVVSASGDGTLKVWDLESGRVIRTLQGHVGWVWKVAVTPDGRRAVSASDDQTLKVWDLESASAVHELETHAGPVRKVAVTPDGRRAVSASEDQTLKVWDLESGRVVRTLEGHAFTVDGVAVTPDGRRAVSASWDRTLKVWELESGRVVQTLEGHAYTVNEVAVTPDGRWAVSASGDQTLKLWDLASGDVLHTFEGHASAVNGVAVTPDGRRAVSASWDQTLKLWDLASGDVLHTFEGHAQGVNDVALSPDGRRAVSASEDQTLNVWDLENGRVVRTLEGHASAVIGVAVSPDGRWAVSASCDRTLKLWDLVGGGCIAAFTCDAGVGCCAFVSAGVVVAGDARGQLHLLSLEMPLFRP